MLFRNIFILINFLVLTLYSQTFDVSTTSQLRQALEDAEQNGENDTIVLEKGVYKTTDDALGTFIYSTDEDYNLTIKSADGLNKNDVILDGDNKDLVLKIHNLQDDKPTTVRLENFTVQNGKGNIYFIVEQYTYVSRLSVDKLNILHSLSKGLYGDTYKVDINNSNISYNQDKGIESSASKLIIENSIIAHNGSTGIDSLTTLFLINSKVSQNKGRGIFSNFRAIIQDSNITMQHDGGIEANYVSLENCIIADNNTTRLGGGINASEFLIKNSKIINNHAKNGGGLYGWYNYGDYIIVNSEISNNSATLDGGGVYIEYSKNLLVTNSVFRNNSANEKGSAIFSTEKTNVINNTFIDSSDSLGTIIYGGGNFINNIIYNNSGIYLTKDSVFYNNLIDFSSLQLDNDINFTKKYNFDTTETVNFAEDREHTLFGSKTIDRGLDFDNKLFEKLYSIKEYNKVLDYLQTDKDGNFRKANEKVDIGAYEYNSTKPSLIDDFFNPSDYPYWHLVSLPGSVMENIADYYKYQILITWTYKDKKWYMSSSKPTYQDFGINKIKYPNNKQGYWVKTKTKSTDFITLGKYDYRYDISLDELRSGWHLVTSKDYNISEHFNDKRVKSIWGYNDSKWKLYIPEVLNKDDIYEKIGIEKLTHIDKKDGYWIYKAKPDATFTITPNKQSFYLGETITFKPISPYIKYSFWKIEGESNNHEDQYYDHILETRFKKAGIYSLRLKIEDTAGEEANSTKIITIIDEVKKPDLSEVLSSPIVINSYDNTIKSTFSRLTDSAILYRYEYKQYNSYLNTTMQLDAYKYGYKGEIVSSTPYTMLKTTKDGIDYEIIINKYYNYEDLNLVEQKVYEKGIMLIETIIKQNGKTTHKYNILTNSNNGGIEVSKSQYQDYLKNFQSYIDNLDITEDTESGSGLKQLLEVLQN